MDQADRARSKRQLRLRKIPRDQILGYIRRTPLQPPVAPHVVINDVQPVAAQKAAANISKSSEQTIPASEVSTQSVQSAPSSQNDVHLSADTSTRAVQPPRPSYSRQLAPFQREPFRSSVLHRPIVSKPLKRHVVLRATDAISPLLIQRTLAVCFVALVAVASYGVINQLTYPSSREVVQSSAVGSGSETSESVLSAATTDQPTNTSTTKEAPKELIIDKLGVRSTVVLVSLDNMNRLLPPTSITDVGWYQSSGNPGSSNTVVMTGQVFGSQRRGVFHSLKALQADDIVEIVRGDERLYTYRVVGKKAYSRSEEDISLLSTSAQLGVNGLTLVAVDNRFNPETNKYADHLAVFLLQVN
jgi:hypothetical protein